MADDGEPIRHAGGAGRESPGLAAHAHRLLGAGRHAEAEAAFQDILRRYPDRPAGLVGLALVATRRGQWQDALDLWDACLERHPSKQQPFWRRMRGRALVGLGREAEAEAACLAFAEASPGDPEPWRELHALVAERWPPSRLLPLLDTIVALAPEDHWSALLRAIVIAKAGDPGPCRERLESMLDDGGGDTVWSVGQLGRMLGTIQFCCCDHRRVVLLERLSRRVERHLPREPEAAGILLARVRMALEDYDGATRILAGLRARGADHPTVAGMWDVCERRAAADFPAYEAPKVFCIGLSKTATTSLDAALRHLGLRSIHWTNPYTQALISDTDLLLFDAFSDIGIASRFEHLYTTFPNARFIYTTRDLGDWVRSVKAHYGLSFDVKEPHQLRRPGLQQRFDGAAGRFEMNLYARHHDWEGAYADYDRRVRHFFADKPPGKLLDMSICGGDGWEALCGFLGLPIPDVPFPVQNVSERPTPGGVPRATGATPRARPGGPSIHAARSMNFGLLVHTPTGNLGDHVQSLAARRLLPRVDRLVERERLHEAADAGPLKVIMNGWWMHEPQRWPPPPNVIPLFVSFHVTTGAARQAMLEGESLEYLRKHAPIGCRDSSTLNAMRAAGIDAYYSGCLTMTFPRRPRAPHGEVLFVDPFRPHFFDALEVAAPVRDRPSPTGPGRPRGPAAEHRDPSRLAGVVGMPGEWHRGARRISAHVERDTLPDAKFAMTESLLGQLAAAKLVVTSRLHALLPAMAMGVPCLFVLKDGGTGTGEGGFLADKGHDCTRDDPRLGGLIDRVPQVTLSRLLRGLPAASWIELAETSPSLDAGLVEAMAARVAEFLA